MSCSQQTKQKSGSSKHKCKKATDIAFPCKQCGQICKNPGSLKRHMNAMHSQAVSLVVATVIYNCVECTAVLQSKEALISHNKTNHQQSTSLPAYEVTLNELESQSTTSSTDQSSDLTVFPCEVCGKVLKSKRNLDNHLQKVQSQADLRSTSSAVLCLINRTLDQDVHLHQLIRQ